MSKLSISLVMILLFSAFSIKSIAGESSRDNELVLSSLSSTVIKQELFNFNIVNLEWGASWPTVPFHGWRSFKAEWKKVQPTENANWDFSAADEHVAKAIANNVEIMLVLSERPIWLEPNSRQTSQFDIPNVFNMADWEKYVTTVVKRYKGRVTLYELWNEPNNRDGFPGTIKQLVEVNKRAYEIIKSIDPSIRVISPAMSTPSINGLNYLEEYFKQGGGDYADIIGYHFYVPPKPPEAMLPGMAGANRLIKKYNINKPLWNTETGWLVLNNDKNEDLTRGWGTPAVSNETAVAYIARAYLLSWASGVERLYWYAWGHRAMGLTEHDGVTPKPVAFAYAELQKWLIDKMIINCTEKPGKTWVCQLKKDSTYKGIVVWNTKGKTQYTIPTEMGQITIRTLDGRRTEPSRAKNVDVGSTPILIESVL